MELRRLRGERLIINSVWVEESFSTTRECLDTGPPQFCRGSIDKMAKINSSPGRKSFSHPPSPRLPGNFIIFASSCKMKMSFHSPRTQQINYESLRTRGEERKSLRFSLNRGWHKFSTSSSSNFDPDRVDWSTFPLDATTTKRQFRRIFEQLLRAKEKTKSERLEN